MAYELKYGSQKGDVYSIGIILYEILFRSQPYDTDAYLPEGKCYKSIYSNNMDYTFVIIFYAFSY